MSIQHESDRDADGVTPTEPGEPARVGTDGAEPTSTPVDAAPADAAPGAIEPASPVDSAPDTLQPTPSVEAAHEAPEAGAGADTTETARRPENREALPGQGLPAYRPPPSPAYAAPPEPVAAASQAAVAASASREAAPPDRRLGWQLLIAGLVLVVVAAVVAVLAIQSGGGTDTHAFGKVSAISGEAAVRPGLDAALRELEVGDEVLTDWLVETSDGATATIDLAGGGVLRIDSHTRLQFLDLAVDPDTGVRARASEPAVELREGRAWLLPGAAEGDAATVRAQFTDGVVEGDGHPVALDCTSVCTVEAPTGGVTVKTREGEELTPTANEVLQVGPGAALDLTIADSASDWARENLAADERAGLSPPEDDRGPGIVASAVLDGTYSVAISVVGPPTGDAIPTALQYPEGETYALDLTTDGNGCDTPPCAIPVSSADSLSGTAQVRDGEVALTFGLPINCFDATHTSVVLPDIGTTAVNATLDIEAVEFDGDRWHVRRVSGTGTIAATMSTTCNPGDVLGTSTSPITLAGS